MPRKRVAKPTPLECITESRFYHGVIDKDETQDILVNQGIGAFFIRSIRSNQKIHYYLTVRVKHGDNDMDYHHYEIISNESAVFLVQSFYEQDGTSRVVMSEPCFCMSHVLSHYEMHRFACSVRLTIGIKRARWKMLRSNVQYSEAGKLGAGNFCSVYKGKLLKYHRGRDRIVAIKVAKHADLSSEALQKMKKQMFEESRTMMDYRNLNVVRLFGVVCDRPPFMVCMEFCLGGSLEDALRKYGEKMEEFEKQIILIDAARGMRYLHVQKCIHRDLASRNCLIDSNGQVKIADFGLSRVMKGDVKKLNESLEEAPLVWMAPECIQRESEFSLKTDVWAFGVVIYEVYHNAKKMFADDDVRAVLRKIRKADMPTITSRTKVKKMQEVLSAIWTLQPEERPDFEKILELLSLAAVPMDLQCIARMQINNIRGVTRTLLPNLCLAVDQIAEHIPTAKSECASDYEDAGLAGKQEPAKVDGKNVKSK